MSKAFIVLFFLVTCSFAQTARPNMDRPRYIDVQNYIIRVSFDAAAKKVFGDTTVQFKPLATGFNEVSLDSVGMDFQSVKLDPAGNDLKYKTTGDKIVITLDKAYTPDDLISIRLRYTTIQPKKGVYFQDAVTDGDLKQDAQIWSQGEAQENRYWFPSFDFPSDKATSEEFITAKNGETVIANGERLTDIDNGDGTYTAHYKMSIPYSTYLTSFVIGKYIRIDDKYGDIPLGFYLYPGKESIAKPAFGKTKLMIEEYERLTGLKFPYNKYDQTVVRNFKFGGMENITATTHSDSDVFLVGVGILAGTVEDLVSHELAHSWFGDLVTCKNWSELWLNEGFATYMEAAWREHAYGRGSYINSIRSDAEQAMADDAVARHRHALFNVIADPEDDGMFDTTTYQKGGSVVHMLREQVGTENFWKAINAYLNAHKMDNATSEDLRKAMEDASGQDLKWFFDQWVYGAGYPKLNVTQTYLPAKKTLHLTVTQTQKADKITPDVFRLPLDVEITVAGKKVLQHIDVTKRVQIFDLKVTGRPTGIAFDPEEKIILKSVKIAPLGK